MIQPVKETGELHCVKCDISKAQYNGGDSRAILAMLRFRSSSSSGEPLYWPTNRVNMKLEVAQWFGEQSFKGGVTIVQVDAFAWEIYFDEASDATLFKVKWL